MNEGEQNEGGGVNSQTGSTRQEKTEIELEDERKTEEERWTGTISEGDNKRITSEYRIDEKMAREGDKKDMGIE